ncbi:MAG: tRNA threonylcarbamoyladenosine dehydratase [Bacteroidales bacterium]|nr:tRNA threonylcarbamoyladenosine dehydratase [Bacteroidales bacterium]
MEVWNQRTIKLLGEVGVKRLTDAHVLVVGVGGVGSAATEQLARAGVGQMTLLDGDTVQPSNLNRQLPALTTTLGLPKVEVMGERLKAINPAMVLTLRYEYLNEDAVAALLDSARFDFVVDAIDTLAPKVGLLEQCLRRGIPVISAMGAGGKVDPSKIKLADIAATTQCPLARVVRRSLRERGFTKGLTVVFSTEQANKNAVILLENEPNKRSTTGTVSYMPVLFGCHMAAYVIQQLTSKP